MSNHEALAKLAPRWAKKIGRTQAISRLLQRDVSVATAEKLCTGRYPSVPREKLAEILSDEMSKDGFTVGAVRSA